MSDMDDGNDMMGEESVSGHAIPGAFFLGFGGFFLLLSVRRLFQAESANAFLASHVPERNITLLKVASVTVLLCTLLGITDLVLEETGGILHITLYILFLVSGFAGYLESCDFLPQDSFRAAVSCALLAEALIWYEHSLMKSNPQDRSIHELAGVTSLGAGICMLISIYTLKNIVPYLGSFLFMAWHGLWLCSAAINIAATESWDSIHITGYFILEGVCLGVVTLLICAVLYRRHKLNPPLKEEEKRYLRVGTVNDDEDDDNVHEETTSDNQAVNV